MWTKNQFSDNFNKGGGLLLSVLLLNLPVLIYYLYFQIELSQTENMQKSLLEYLVQSSENDPTLVVNRKMFNNNCLTTAI